VDVDEALKVANFDDLSPRAVRAFLDLQAGGEWEVCRYDKDHLTSYYGKFSQSEKLYHTQGKIDDDAFKEFVTFFVN
jgi:hypothetical protein